LSFTRGTREILGRVEDCIIMMAGVEMVEDL
jgi:hypothetical protein